MTETPFKIHTAPGFEAVAETFCANFEDGGELGAQFCVLKDGEVIVDCLGGWANKDKTQPIKDNTLMSVYSSGKAMAALVIAWLVDQDRIGYNQTVASLWPEFGAEGKDRLTIAQVMSHQAGLSGFSNPDWKREDWYDWDKACAELAAQAPLFPPGEACGYHPITFGILAGEIARLADEEGRNLGQILLEEFCQNQNLDVWIGLPDKEHERCAELIRPKRAAKFGAPNPALKAAFFMKGSSSDTSDLAKWRRAQLAGSNCQATAKSLATMMQVFNHGKLGHFGPNATTVGHSGWGGSCVFADKQSGLTGCYAMNKQENTLLGDARSVRLVDAVYDCL